MQLEQLRGNDIGTIFAWIPRLGDGPESLARLTYPLFTQLAFYNSAQQIEQLEFSLDHVRQGNSIQTSVGLWFMSIEAYINSILRISCLARDKSFDAVKTKDFGPRIQALFDLLGIDRTGYYSGPFQRLEEFKRYRNELFHDRSNDTPLEFHKTSFSGNPMYANQVDVMQACVIALETYQAFRHTIPGKDLMPQVMVTKDDSFFYEPINELYEAVLRPYFEGALSKHSLTSSVALNVTSKPLDESQIFSDVDIQIIIKAVPDEKFDVRPSSERTSLGQTLFDKFRGKAVFDTKQHFRIPNYDRR